MVAGNVRPLAGRRGGRPVIVRLFVGMFVAGVLWIFIVAARADIPLHLAFYGLALMVPAVTVASLVIYARSTK